MSSNQSRNKVLISTIPSWPGGVAAMVAWAVGELRAANFEPVLAWYEPLSMSPTLSVPFTRLGRARPSVECRKLPSGIGGHAVGAWLPELEFMHYHPTRIWREIVAGFDLHLAISGTCLPARPLVASGKPHLTWIASDWSGDRRSRAASFAPGRRLVDRLLVRPVTLRLERSILRRTYPIALGEPTRKALDHTAGRPVVRDILHLPIDLASLPSESRPVPGRIGVCGRMSDPRKKLDLFLKALAWCRARNPSIRGEVLDPNQGEEPGALLKELDLGLEAVTFSFCLPRQQYLERLRSFDLFVVSSDQEGYGISALEAMASGCPVVSTRCGGPEEFVRDGETGFLAASTPEALGQRVLELVNNRLLRERLGAAARRLVADQYSVALARNVFWRAFETIFGEKTTEGRNPS